jgi:predicted glutamine amidotransferase
MCGLVACVTKTKNGFNNFDLDVFTELLFANTLRGKDSTGIFAVNNLGNVGIVKDAVTAEPFINSEEYKKVKEELYKEGWAVVGHNRAATRGTVTDVNAHPFWVDDKLVLVHNGSFYGDHKKLADVDVDSHAIAINLANHIDDYEEALSKVNAAYALIFYDIENKKLQFIRNSQRPLWKAETASAIYFASEPHMLSWILNRNNIKILDKIVQLEEHVLYTIELLGNDGYDEKEKKLNCSFRHTPSTSTQATNGPWWEDANDACAYQNWHNTRHGTPHKPNYVPYIEHTRVGAEPDPVGPTPTETELDTLNSLCVPNLGDTHFKHSEWVELRREKYNPGKRITVVVDDWVDLQNANETYYLKGHTLDSHSVPIIFGIKGDTLNHLINTVTENGLFFDIEIDRVIWKRTEELPKPGVTSLESMDGVVFILGKNHTLVMQGTNNAQTH